MIKEKANRIIHNGGINFAELFIDSMHFELTNAMKHSALSMNECCVTFLHILIKSEIPLTSSIIFAVDDSLLGAVCNIS